MHKINTRGVIANLQKIDRSYICIELFMPALMKAFSYITAYYGSGIHAFNTAWTVLIRYRGNVFTGTFTPNIIDRWSVYWQQLK